MKIDGMREVIRDLNAMASKADKATSSALGRVAKGVSTEVGRKVREEYTVKSGDVKNTIAIRNRGSNEIDVTSRGGSLSLPKFKLTPKAPTPGKKSKLVKAAVRKGGAKTIKSGFVSAMGSGHVGAFTRVKGQQKKRVRNAKGDYPSLPIEEGFGPAVPVMANNTEVVEHVEDEAYRRMMDRLDHEIRRILK